MSLRSISFSSLFTVVTPVSDKLPYLINKGCIFLLSYYLLYNMKYIRVYYNIYIHIMSSTNKNTAFISLINNSFLLISQKMSDHLFKFENSKNLILFHNLFKFTPKNYKIIFACFQLFFNPNFISQKNSIDYTKVFFIIMMTFYFHAFLYKQLYYRSYLLVLLLFKHI